MNGRLSNPAEWPAPFTDDGSGALRMVPIAEGHYVRASDNLIQEKRGAVA